MLRLYLAALLLASVQCSTPDNVSSRLMIHIPHSLFKEEGYDHREALFGVPPYGGSIAQNVYYADSDLCDPTVDTRAGFPARDVDGSGQMAPWPSPYILMVDRGNCTFVKKVRNAQRSGAAGVVIADNTCLCSDQDCMNESELPSCETTEPIMADDGSGADISIPSFLMFKRDADKVKIELKANRPVQIEMAWSLPNPDDRVEYDLWTVPTDVVSKDFLASFRDVAKALGDRAYFTPHMYIYDGIRSHCQGNDGENFCYNLCTNNGRYCATDPDNDLDRGISGADVVRESLRRLCIWNHYGAADGVGEVWWDYVREFQNRCSAADYFADPACIQDAYKHSSVDGPAVDRCMADSGGLEKDAPNAFLDIEVNSQSQRGVVVVPTAFVNTAALRGALTSGNVFKAICAGFVAGSEPDQCRTCSNCHDPADCIRNRGRCAMPNGSFPAAAPSDGSVSRGSFFMTIFFIIAAFGAAGVWHYKKTRDDMRDQVRGILAEYMPLEDQDDGGAGGSPMDFARRGAATSLIS
jgi:hypothetical protein